jgi:hypothetical protein
MNKSDIAWEVRRLRCDGEGLSIPAIARELSLTVEVVAEMLRWLPCEECCRPTPKRSRFRGHGLRRCHRCYARQQRLIDEPFRRPSPDSKPEAPGVSRAVGRGTMLVAPLAEEFLRRDITATQVALRLGWMTQGHADGDRVRRGLGLRRDSSTGKCRLRIDERSFKNLARAIDPDLVLQFDL